MNISGNWLWNWFSIETKPCSLSEVMFLLSEVSFNGQLNYIAKFNKSIRLLPKHCTFYLEITIHYHRIKYVWFSLTHIFWHEHRVLDSVFMQKYAEIFGLWLKFIWLNLHWSIPRMIRNLSVLCDIIFTLSITFPFLKENCPSK